MATPSPLPSSLTVNCDPHHHSSAPYPSYPPYPLSSVNDGVNSIHNAINDTGKHILNQGAVIQSRQSDAAEKILLQNAGAQLAAQQSMARVTDVLNASLQSHEQCSERRHDRLDWKHDFLKKEICDISRDVLLTRCEVERSILANRAEIQKDISETKGCLDLSVMRTKCDLEKDLALTKCSIERQAAENAAKIELQACQNKECLSRQMAELGCMLKDKIETRYHDTAQLIRDQQTDCLKAKLAETQHELLFARLARTCGSCPELPLPGLSAK